MPGLAGKKAKRTVTASFRLDEESFLALQEEAERNKVSLNTLVNQALTFHVKTSRFGPTRPLRISDVLLRRFLDEIPDDDLMRISKERAEEYAKILIRTRYGGLNERNILRFAYDLCQYFGWGVYSERQLERGKLLVTIEHTLGKKYSTFTSNVMKTLLAMAGLKPEVAETDVAVTIEIPNV
jgi:hypothetical protein